MDAGLELAAVQAAGAVVVEGERLAFRANDAVGVGRLGDDFAVYLLSAGGELWGVLGPIDELPPQPPQAGTRSTAFEDDHWRVYTEAVEPAGGSQGWLQVAQEMDSIDEALASLRERAIVGLPLALVLAGLGGFFLAGWALRPVNQITRTAAAIDGRDLTRRIAYRGPADEIGRLAATFDRMLDRLQAAFERERRFTGDAAHELRTPLAALKGRIEVTLSRPRPAAEYAATLGEMAGQVERLIQMSGDLLFMARLERSGTGRPAQDIELDGLLAAVADQLAPLAQANSVALEQDVPAGLAVQGELDLLIRLFLNLVDNAVKYSPPGGQVKIAAQPANGQVTVTVHNSGPAIPAEHLPHLFERFYRVEDDRGRRNGASGGAGLGLAIAQEIVRAHGGSISVASTPAEGTTFSVWLPKG
jgi:heavy metal sensor kinase